MMISADGKRYHVNDRCEPRFEKIGLRGFLTRLDTNWAVQSQNMARSLKFTI